MHPPQEPLVRLADSRPAACCAGLSMGAQARAALADDPGPTAFLTTLLQTACWDDAVRYLAHALPAVDAVLWACDCVALLPATTLSEAAQRALQAAQQWAAQPCAEHCDAAALAAAAPGLQSADAARFAALAAAWSGESLAPLGLPVVAPPPGLAAQAVEAAVLLVGPAAAAGLEGCVATGILRARAGAEASAARA